jgi:hypothetical protein
MSLCVHYTLKACIIEPKICVGHHLSFYWATEKTKKWVSGSSSALATMKTCCLYVDVGFVCSLHCSGQGFFKNQVQFPCKLIEY